MRCAIIVLHDAFGEQEIAEEGCNEQVASIKTGECFPREGRPGYRIGDSSEYPIQLSEGRSSVLEVSWETHDHVRSDIVG